MKLSGVRRDYDRAGAMNDLLAPCAFVDDRTVLTKRHDLFSVLRIGGMEVECLDPDQIAAFTHRFEAALRGLSPEYRVYQYVLKRDTPDLDESDAWHDLAARRARSIEARVTGLYTIELYMVILRMKPMDVKPSRLRSMLSVHDSLETTREDLTADAEILTSAVDSIAAQLSGMLRPTVLTREAIGLFLRRLVNYIPWRAEITPSMQNLDLDQQIALSGIECWPSHLIQDDQYIKVLSLAHPPSETFASMLHDLLKIECNCVIASEWVRMNSGEARRLIDKKRSFFHFAKTKITLSSATVNKNPLPHEVLVDDSKDDLIKDLARCMSAIERDGYLGRYSLTVALYHSDPLTVRKAVSKTVEVFAARDAQLIEERYNLRNAWLSIVPGNYAFNQRQLLLMNTNYADLALIYAPATGARRNEHLNAPALGVLETQEGVLYHLNLHYQDVGHTAILGATGSGKTVLVNYLTHSYQQYEPFTVVLDLGGSYRKLAEVYGGKHLHVGKTRLAINPFCLEPTPPNMDFIFAFVRLLIERNHSLTTEERKDLYEAIRDVYALPVKVRRLKTLAQTTGRTYGKHLDEWVGTGRLAQYFDHSTDELTFADFQAFDFEGMDNPEVLEPLLFYTLHRANERIQNRRQLLRPKLFVCDEAWRFFKHPVTREYIREALKTWRKKNAVMILATQSGNDLMREEMMSVIAESCFTKVFLANPGMDASAYRDAFNLNETEAAIISRLIPKRQMLLKQPDVSKVLTLNLDPESLRIFSTNVMENYETTAVDVAAGVVRG